MPNLRRQPPAPPSGVALVATFNPNIPGQYDWEVVNLSNFLPLSGGTLTGDLIITPASNDTHTLQVNQAGGSPDVFTVDTTNAKVIIRQVADSGVMSANLLASTDFTNPTFWTLGTGWVGSATTATATAASGTLAMTSANFAPTIGLTYLVQVRVTATTNGLQLSFGGVTPLLGSAANNLNITGAPFVYNFYITAVSTAPLVLTPIGGNFTGSVTRLAQANNGFIKLATPSTPAITIEDHLAATSLEVRGGLASLDNFGIGLGALANSPATIAQGNLAIGFLALNGNLTGQNNVALGPMALQSLTAGSANIAIGLEAMQYASGVVVSNNNISIGDDSLLSMIAGSNNTAIGSGTLQLGQQLNDLLAIGFNALFALLTGTGNSAIGTLALVALVTGSNNTVLGYHAAQFTTSSNGNTIIGAGTAATLTSGDNNLLIGNGVDVPAAATSNYLNIGGTIIGNTSTKQGFVKSFLRATSTTPDTASVTTDKVILVTTGAGAFAENLPTPVGNAGKEFTVKKVDAGAGTVTVTPAAGTIDGAATFSLAAQNKYVTVISDGANYFVIANN